MDKVPFPAFVDSSMRKTFVSCSKKYFWNYLLHLHRKGLNIHLHFGGCFASGIETMRTAFYGEGKTPLEAFAAGAERIIREWGDVEPDLPYGTKTLESCLIALLSFLEEYPLDSDPIRPLMIDGKPAVEFSFAIPIPGILHPTTGEPILYAGRFDMLAVYNNLLMINDEKTSGRLGDYWKKTWEMASQFTGYQWIAKQFGYNIQGIIIRGVGILKKEITHALVIEQRSNHLTEIWLEQLQRDVKRMIRSWEEQYWDYALDDACTAYGGCPYITLCKANEDKLLGLINSEYEVREWNPLEK